MYKEIIKSETIKRKDTVSRSFITEYSGSLEAMATDCSVLPDRSGRSKCIPEMKYMYTRDEVHVYQR